MLQTIQFPVNEVTGCVFVGKKLCELYCTSSAVPAGFIVGQPNVAQPPQSGKLFKVTGLNMCGYKPYKLIGYC